MKFRSSLSDYDNHNLFSPRMYHLMDRLKGKLKLFDIVDDEQVIRKGQDTIGYLPTKEAIYFATQLPHIGHEIAHMVEIDDARVLIPDWGLRLYRLHKETASAIVAGIARETRVRAIGAYISNYTGDADRSLNDNPVWAEAMEKHLPYGRFKTKKDIENWIADMHTRTYVNWNFDRVEAIWNKRVDRILDWMETKEDKVAA